MKSGSKSGSMASMSKSLKPGAVIKGGLKQGQCKGKMVSTKENYSKSY